MRVIRPDTYIASWTYYAVAGAVLGLAFIYPLFWVLLIPGIVLWCYGLAGTQTMRQAFCGGWVLGTTSFLFVLSWYWTVYPLDWLAIDSVPLALSIIALYWSLTSVVLGLGAAVSSTVLWMLRARGTSRGILALLAPAIITLGYVVGSLLFSLYTLGPGSDVNSAFSFGYPGYLLMEHGVLRFGGMFGGVYALSYIGIGLGVLVYAGMERASVRWGVLVLPVCMLVLWGTAFLEVSIAVPGAAKYIRVVAISSDVPLEQHVSLEQERMRQEQLWSAIASVHTKDPDYVVLPEGAQLTRGLSTEEVFATTASIGIADAALIDSVTAITRAGAVVSRTVAFDPQTASAYRFDKQYLVPQGEYVPYFYDFVFWVFGQQDFFGARTARMSYEQGTEEEGARPAYLPGILSCFEGVWPTSVARITARSDVPFIAHPISHNWFNAPHVLWNQLDQMTSLQALANSVPIVQVGNRGPTVTYDRYGKKLLPTLVTVTDDHGVYIFDIPTR